MRDIFTGFSVISLLKRPREISFIPCHINFSGHSDALSPAECIGTMLRHQKFLQILSQIEIAVTYISDPFGLFAYFGTK